MHLIHCVYKLIKCDGNKKIIHLDYRYYTCHETFILIYKFIYVLYLGNVNKLTNDNLVHMVLED